jgi:hypothetical protein
LLLAFTSVYVLPQEVLVGDYNNFKNIRFSGNQSFTAEALRGGLTADSDIILRSHELAPLQPFLQIIQSQLTRGYRANGFAQAKVTALAEEKGIRVTIVEGPRCFAGKMEFENAADLPLADIEKRLTQRYPPLEDLRYSPSILQAPPGSSFLNTSFRITREFQYLDSVGNPVQPEEPLWKPGKPAPFGLEKQIEAVIQAALSDASVLKADFEAHIEPTPPNALLRIKFKSHSKPAVLSDILVSGSKLNHPSELLRFLGLKEGLPASKEIVRRTELLLYRSARFQSFKVELESVDDGHANLHIHVDDVENAPKLEEPFSRMAIGFLNFQHWLERLPLTRDSIHAKLTNPDLHASLELNVSVNEGAVISLEASTPGPLPGYSIALLLSSNAAGFFSPRRGEKFLVQNPDISSSVAIGFQPTTDEPGRDHIDILFAVISSHPTNEPVFSLKTMLAPVSFARFGRGTNLTAEFKGGEMIVSADSPILRIDEKTGRLINSSGVGELSWDLHPSSPGAVQEYILKHAALTNSYDPKRPVGSFASYGLRELLDVYLAFHPENFKNPQESRLAIETVGKLFSPETFNFLDQAFPTSTDENSFAIPNPFGIGPTQENPISIVAAYAFKYSDAIFDRHSWPWKVTREIVFVTKNETTYTDRELSILYDSPDLGPIGYYTIGWFLQLIQSPQANAFATRGLLRLDVNHFKKDYALLFTENSSLARSIQAALTKIPSLNEKESAALISAAPWLKPLFQSPARALPVDTRGLLQLVGPVLDQQWEDQWKTEMRQAFRDLLKKITVPLEQ